MKFQFQEHDQSFIERVKTAAPPVIAVLHPDWRGIRSSTENHVEHCYFLEDNLTPESAKYVSEVLKATGCKKVVYGALPLSYAHLVRALHHLYPDIEQYITWHGSFLQSNEDYNWDSFKGALCLCKEGAVKKIGFVKKGMEVVVRKLGVETAFFSNYVKGIPESPSVPLQGGPHLGIWAIAPIWRKNPFAMLAASAVIPGAKVYVRGQDQRAQDFSELFGVDLMPGLQAVPMDQMPQALSEMHLNLYVTLSECSPMTPLESLAVGAPCLIGPTSHLFENWKSLYDALVVPFPDRSLVIAEYMENALENRTQIIAEYAKFAIQYNEQAKSEFASFINL